MNVRWRRHRGKLAIALIAVLAIGWFVYAHRGELNRDTLVAYGKGLHAATFILAFLILPLVGFPVSIFLFLAGVRFGLYGGMLVSGIAVLFHNFAAFRLAHGLFRSRVRNRLRRAGHNIPSIKKEHRVWFTALFAALHGPPYIAKLYLLALTDIPLRIYFWVGAPIYVAFCIIPVGAGSAVMNFDPKWIYILVGASLALLIFGYWLKNRFGAVIKGNG